MKTTASNLASILFIAMIMVYCQPPDDDPVIGPPVERIEIDYNATLDFEDQEHKLNYGLFRDMLLTRLYTKSHINDARISDHKIELSHTAYFLDFGNVVQMDGGEMTITTADGDRIFGRYEGFGNLKTDPASLNLTIRITGGTGFFSGASGYLNGTCPRHNWHPHVNEMNITGKIILMREREIIVA